jgi:nickel/cobalt transporter (NiCoT) family protein
VVATGQVAQLIGGIEALGLASDKLGLRGKFWDSTGALNGNFNELGFAIIGTFILVGSACSYSVNSKAGDRYLPRNTRSP